MLHPPFGSDVTNTGLVQLAGAGGAVGVGVVVWVGVGVAVAVVGVAVVGVAGGVVVWVGVAGGVAVAVAVRVGVGVGVAGPWRGGARRGCVLMPPRAAANSFSLRPPIGSTRPRRVTSPVIATSCRTGYRS